jgi:hypothetical protein
VIVDQRKESLVMDHRRGEHFFGQRQELVRERAGDHFRVLDQVGHFLQQHLTAVLLRHAASASARLSVQLASDAFLSLAALEHHEILGKALAIIVESLDLDRPPGAAAGREEPVPEGDGTRANLLHQRALRPACAIDRERHHPPAIQEEHPANRTREGQLTPPIVERGVPLHGLGKRQIAQQPGEHVGQHVDGGFAANLLSVGEIGPLRRFQPFQDVHVHVALLREPDGRRRRIARRIKRGRHRGAGHQVLEVGLPFGQLANAGGEPPRCAVAFNRRRRGEP